MRVAVFRAAEDGRRTASLLEDLGHEAVLAPAIRIVATGASVEPGNADELIFTSAHAPAALASHPGGIAGVSNLPCWCVGGRTAAAARSAGFDCLTTVGGTAADLAAAITAGGGEARLTLVAGRDRKPDLEQALAQAGRSLAVIEAYAARPVTAWPADTVARLADVAVALHYSRRSATLAQRLATVSGLAGCFQAWTHCCLSKDVSGGLELRAGKTATVAKAPDESALLALLDLHSLR